MPQVPSQTTRVKEPTLSLLNDAWSMMIVSQSRLSVGFLDKKPTASISIDLVDLHIGGLDDSGSLTIYTGVGGGLELFPRPSVLRTPAVETQRLLGG